MDLKTLQDKVGKLVRWAFGTEEHNTSKHCEGEHTPSRKMDDSQIKHFEILSLDIYTLGVIFLPK